MLDQIKAIIAQHVPEQVSQELKEYLSDHEELKKSVVRLKRRIEELEQQVTAENRRGNEYYERLQLHENLDSRERVISEKEFEHRITKEKEKFANEKVDLVKEVLTKVLSNRIIRETIHVPQTDYDTDWSNGNPKRSPVGQSFIPVDNTREEG